MSRTLRKDGNELVIIEWGHPTKLKCDSKICGKEFTRPRSVVTNRVNNFHFCTIACYWVWRKTPEGIASKKLDYKKGHDSTGNDPIHRFNKATHSKKGLFNK